MSDSEGDEVTYSDNEGSISRSEGSRSPSPEARPNKAKKNHRVQDDSDDDDELRDSEEAEDDDDYDYSRNKRKKRRKGNEFIIDEAEVDEDADEDDEAWDEDDGGFGNVNEAEEAGRTARDLEAKLRKERHGGLGFDDGMDAQAIEDYYLKRYNEDTAALAHFGDGGEEMSDEITQQTLLPSVKKDPNLWMVKCVIGTEKECLLRLMNKFIAYQDTDEPLQIRSVVVPDHLKGYIYVELLNKRMSSKLSKASQI